MFNCAIIPSCFVVIVLIFHGQSVSQFLQSLTILIKASICNCVEQSPYSEDNSCSPAQEIACLWSITVFNITLRQPTLCLYPQLDKSSPHSHSRFPFFKIQFNIILVSTPRSSKRYPAFKLSDKIFVCYSPRNNACYMSRSFHPTPSDIWI